jgi:raffinose/stachyose/melibiose transport system permease protein
MTDNRRRGIRSSGRRPGGLARSSPSRRWSCSPALVLFPILATALNGFKDLSELRTNPFGLPRVWMWSNYWDILTGYRYWQVLGNSLLIALLTVALTLALRRWRPSPSRICASSATSSF